MKNRQVLLKRKTKETDISVKLNIDGQGKYKINTGIAFLDHMLSLFAKHGVFDLELKAKGDLDIDIHHTNEDIGIALGEAFSKALSTKVSIKRFGVGYSILDESMARSVIDISGRPHLEVSLVKNKIQEEKDYNFSYFKHFLRSFVNASKVTLHLDVLKGNDFHHVLEVCFKALAISLDQATIIDKRKKGIPSTKGKL